MARNDLQTRFDVQYRSPKIATREIEESRTEPQHVNTYLVLFDWFDQDFVYTDRLDPLPCQVLD